MAPHCIYINPFCWSTVHPGTVSLQLVTSEHGPFAVVGRGNVVPAGFCDANYYCPGGQDSPTPGDLLCPAGHMCPQGTTIPELCANGTYQQHNGRDHCDICPPGYYCDPSLGAPVVTPSPCPVGHYCPEGTGLSTSFPCPPGTYAPDLGYESLDNCTACPAGYYCEDSGLSMTTGECLAGYYCTGGADSATPWDHLVSGVMMRTCLIRPVTKSIVNILSFFSSLFSKIKSGSHHL